ncbi:hypothetical protein BC939DRAFT_218390 [Gamsiella multidivaricata]|uniref:uncharacterized protein n=1 Tax=Gamsiella multidivaricata TaxID=101098 RepID=UPI00221E5C6B|nr:uncharacterized protein BC939DRAFT_218390 [Gamsiella multidivaricata]KAI7820836.1 hypothetical protein BC939DRAFT_218390 [Gamsiella multidivaricata]
MLPVKHPSFPMHLSVTNNTPCPVSLPVYIRRPVFFFQNDVLSSLERYHCIFFCLGQENCIAPLFEFEVPLLIQLSCMVCDDLGNIDELLKFPRSGSSVQQLYIIPVSRVIHPEPFLRP